MQSKCSFGSICRINYGFVSPLVFLIAVTALGACGPAQGSDPSSVDTSTTPREGVHIVLANDRVEVTSPQEMCTWPLVADAVVASYGPSHWDTPDVAATGTHPVCSDSARLCNFHTSQVHEN